MILSLSKYNILSKSFFLYYFGSQRPMMYFPDEHMFPGRRPMLTLPMDGHSHLHQSMLPFGMVDPFQRMNDMMRNFVSL